MSKGKESRRRRHTPNFETMNYAARRKLAELNNNAQQKQLIRIYERDQGICQICHRPCARTEASRDHLVSPLKLSFELANDDANVQLAHSACNNKRAQPPKAQPRVIRDSSRKHLTTTIGELFPHLQQWAHELSNESD